jgi:hypothetical protein
MSNERRSNDRDIVDHEKRLIEVEHQIRRLVWHHENDNVIGQLSDHNTRLGIFEKLAENITEKRNHAAFTDEQVKRIKELFDERAEVHAGRAFLRMVGAAIIGATSALLAYLGIRGH